MNFDPSEAQGLIAQSFARFLDEHSSLPKVRAAMATGVDRALWRGFADLGGFAMRVPEASGGLELGVFDAVLVAEELGRKLATGPILEAIVAARVLASCSTGTASALLDRVIAGEAIVTLALHDAARRPSQWVQGAAAAEAVLVRDGKSVFLVRPPGGPQTPEPNLASTAMAEIKLDAPDRELLGKGDGVANAFAAAVEEWKLLMAAALNGLSREALRMAAAYASEREAFGRLIGMYQGVSHPLADLATAAEGGRYLVWRTVWDIAQGSASAGAHVPMTLWWAIRTAGGAGGQGLHTFGGYGLSTEYDIHLYNLRARAWPLVWGDPERLLDEAARRLYQGEAVVLPEVGEVSVDFDRGEEAEALAAEMRDFFERTLTPELKAKAHYSFDGHDPGVHKKLADEGLLYPQWPKELGGRDANPYASVAAGDVFEDYDWTRHMIGTTGMVGAIINRFGSPELKSEVLTKIAAGTATCSLGFSEPSGGSDVFAAKTRATPDGNGWRIDGQKMFTSGANVADYVLLLTRTNTEAAKHRGLTMFIVPLKAEGVEIQPVYTFQDERTNITFYSGVHVPDSYRLGEVDGGASVMAASLELEHSASFSRVQHKMLQAAEELCRIIVDDDGRPLIESKDALARLARVAAHNAVSEVLGDRALWRGVEKRPNRGEGSMSKLFSSELFLSDAADLLELTAPLSLSKREGAARFLNQSYRHAHGTTIYGGTSEVHRSVVAERGLGLPRTRG